MNTTVRRKPRILVVDDDPGLLRLLTIRLRAENYEVEPMENGVQALAAAPLEQTEALEQLRAMWHGERIGVIGHSLGGHNALFTAAFDERLKAVVTSCGFTPFHDYYKGKLAGWTSDRYMPRIRDVYGNDPDKVPFDFYEIVGSLAPRGLFSNSPIHDSNFDLDGVKNAFQKGSEVYSLFDAKPQLQLVTPDAPHDFPEAERMKAYEWLQRQLK